MTRLRKLAGSFWIRALVSFGLLGLVISQVDLSGGASRLSHGRWGWFVAAVVALFVSFLIAARRWALFLEAARVGGAVSDAVRAYLIGAFTTNFLPTQFGGDLTRAWLAGRQGTRIRAATTVVVDRATAIACLIVVAWLAYAADPAHVPSDLVVALAVASGALAGAALVAVLLARRLAEARSAARACVRRGVLSRTVALGLAFQALVALVLWLVAQSIALRVPFSVLAVTLPVVLLLSAAPVSIAGLGVREGSFVLLLGQAGVSATDATLLSLMSGATFAVASLPGGVAMLAQRSVAAAQSEDREQERREEDLDACDRRGGPQHRELLVRQRAEAARDPRADDDAAHGEAGEHQRAPGQEPVLQPEARLHALEPRVAFAHEVNAERPPAQA